MNAILSWGHLYKHSSPTFCSFQMELVFHFFKDFFFFKILFIQAALVAQQFGAAFGLGCDPEDIGLPDREPASPSAYVSAFLCMSLMNKHIKI